MTKGGGDAWISESTTLTRRRSVGRRADCEKSSMSSLEEPTEVKVKRDSSALADTASENSGVFDERNPFSRNFIRHAPIFQK